MNRQEHLFTLVANHQESSFETPSPGEKNKCSQNLSSAGGLSFRDLFCLTRQTLQPQHL